MLRFIATRFLISTYLGAALATATCGGYIIITTGLLIAAATRELRGRKTVIAIFSFFSLSLSCREFRNIADTSSGKRARARRCTVVMGLPRSRKLIKGRENNLLILNGRPVAIVSANELPFRG